MGGCARYAYRPAAIARRGCYAILLLPLLAGATTRGADIDPRAALTSDQARDDARRNVPLAKVDPAYRQAVSDVLANPSLFRRMPTSVVEPLTM